MSAPIRATVVSDLEGTLTTGETWKGVLRHLRQHGRAPAVSAFLARKLPGVLLARAGVLDEGRVRQGWMTDLPALLRGMDGPAVEELAEWVVENELWPNRRDDVLLELERHRQGGARIVLASGTYQPILSAFARRIGAEAVGTPLELRGGKLAGRVVGLINVGEVKASRVAAHLNAAPDHAYGDTAADLPLLRGAHTPVAVHPDARLHAEALARGWRVLGEPVAARS